MSIPSITSSDKLTVLAWEKMAIRDEINRLAGGSIMLGIPPDPELRKELESLPLESWREYFLAKENDEEEYYACLLVRNQGLKNGQKEDN